MKNLIIQSQYQKDYLKILLQDSLRITERNFKLLEISVNDFDGEIDDYFLKSLDAQRENVLELKNLLDQLNRMGDFTK